MEHEPAFHVLAIYQNETFAGFIAFWQREHWHYGEHFAIDASLRGGGIGTKAFQLFLQMDSRPLIGEIELPTDSIAKSLACRTPTSSRSGRDSRRTYIY